MRRLPNEKLSWITIYEWVDGDPRSKIPWDEKPLGSTNRPLYQLLENDRYLVLKLLDLLYSLKDIQTVLNNYSKLHTDVVIKRSGIEIPGYPGGILPTSVHTDLDVRVSAIGEYRREYRDHRGRCNYTDHGDYHEDVAHKDYPGHNDQHGDTTRHTDQSVTNTTLLHKPLWVAKYTPSLESSEEYSLLHVDHNDSHLDISYSGGAPRRLYHADRSIQAPAHSFTYIPFWSTRDLQRYLSDGTLSPPSYVPQESSMRSHHYDAEVPSESPVEYRATAHGDHSDVDRPLSVIVNSTNNRRRSNPYYGMYHSVDREELAGGLSQAIVNVVSHSDRVEHQDYHSDSGFGFHGDLQHHDSHQDAIEHCDFTDPHIDYISHGDYEHQDRTDPQVGNHADYTDHANISHGDSSQVTTDPCTHTDTPWVHQDLPALPHIDSSSHTDFWPIIYDVFPLRATDPHPLLDKPHSDIWPSLVHGDNLGGQVYHSDFTLSPPFHADHMDSGPPTSWGGIIELPGVIRIGNSYYYVNPHYDTYSVNNHSDKTVVLPPGALHADFPYTPASYSYSHTDQVRHTDNILLGVLGMNHTDHGDQTQHGDQPEERFVLVGREHTDTPPHLDERPHGDTIVYQDQPPRPHLDHSDHGDSTHCDYGSYGSHTDVHNDYPHQDHNDHANSAYSGTYNQHTDIPHADHTDHGDV